MPDAALAVCVARMARYSSRSAEDPMLLLSVIAGCFPPCGAGTHAKDASCVADGIDTGPEDTDADTDADADTDSDTDGDTHTDTDTGTGDYTVCDDGSAAFLTVQDAVDAAVDGDTVSVCPGIFVGFSARDRALRIVGAGTAETMIFGTTDPAAEVTGGEVTLADLSLRSATNALRADGSTIVLEDVRFAENASTTMIRLSDTDFTMDGGVVEDNEESDFLYADSATLSAKRVRHVVFRNNVGGSPFAAFTDPAAVSNCMFLNNTLDTGGTLLALSNPVREGATFTNNLIYGNSCPDPGYCKILYLYAADFENNIVAENGLSQLSIDDNEGTAPSFIQYNDFYANQDTASTTITGTGNVSVDPAFTDAAAADFTLRYGYSSVIDVGNPAAAYDDTDGTRNDMGAFGGAGGAWTPG